MVRFAVILTWLLASCGGTTSVEAHYEGTSDLRFEGWTLDDDGEPRAEGGWTFYYADGEVQAAGKFEAGALPGEGALHEDRTVVPSEGRDGWWMFTDQEGRLLAEGDYEEGTRKDLWVTWYENGHQCCTGKFSVGQEDGYHVHWDPEGNKRDTRYYVDGLLSGPRLIMNGDGDVLWSGEYEGGILLSRDPAGAEEPEVHELRECLESAEIGMATPINRFSTDFARQLGQ